MQFIFIRKVLITGISLAALSSSAQADQADKRASLMVEGMSRTEIINQLQESAPAIPRFDIRAYNYVSEALHGSMSPKPSTVFPQAIGLAATWNLDLVHRVADTVSDEVQGFYAQARADNGKTGAYEGLNVFSPNINIFRDPRWGRGQETYGEDPYLTSRMGVAYITGLQGPDANHPKLIATAKHFAVHSGPESGRYGFNADVSKHDLFETYLPAFEAAVKEGQVQAVMCSYNRINGVPACANEWLLSTLLRKQWGFKGYIVSDDSAIPMMYWNHHTAKGFVDAALQALSAGTDLPNNDTLKLANKMLAWADFTGRLNIEKAKAALVRILSSRIRLGMFDAPNGLWNQGPYQIDSAEHRALAKRAAQESIVLLKNDQNLLPLAKGQVVSIMGRANDAARLIGNYSGHSSNTITPYMALRNEGVLGVSKIGVVFAGLTPSEEGERTDRKSIELNPQDVARMIRLRATGYKIILVLSGGASIAFDPNLADAILQIWYPGEEAGSAITDVLYGRVNPSGHLPVTFYRSTQDLPPFDDYSMAGRTYRYFTGKPLFQFGYGLSYSSFEFRNAKLNRTGPTDFCVTQSITNTSSRDGQAVAQLYVVAPRGPISALKRFEKISLNAGETKSVHFCLNSNDLATIGEDGTSAVVSGHYTIMIGDHSPASPGDASLLTLTFDLL